MIKIFLSVRNRLEITKKCIQALYKNSHYKFHLYVYNNLTDYKTDEHFMYFYNLYEKDLIKQITFNTKNSTFNAFSKAISSNQFGYNHLIDPNKDKYSFLMFLDNDIIVTKDWDKILLRAWKDVKKYKLGSIKVIGQMPGGIKKSKNCDYKIAGLDAILGKLGGSGFWSVETNFFDKIGLLPVNDFVGLNKKHDQIYWRILDRYSKGQPYILGLNHKLCVHCGKMSGSICNTLTKDKNSDISFEENEEKIKSLNFEDFYDLVIKNKKFEKNW